MYSLTIVLTEVHACPLYTFVSARIYILCTQYSLYARVLIQNR